MAEARPDILERFSERGLRCTSQRYAVLECLMELGGHPSAEELHRSVNRRIPRASLATIYKNLHALTSAGLLREVYLEGHAVRYEANMERHHHFVCDQCGNVEDMEWCDVPKPRSGSLGKRILRECELIFRGLCTKCASRRASR